MAGRAMAAIRAAVRAGKAAAMTEAAAAQEMERPSTPTGPATPRGEAVHGRRPSGASASSVASSLLKEKASEVTMDLGRYMSKIRKTQANIPTNPA